MEYIDIFDADFNHIGKEEKNEAHKRGYWHQVFHCWIIRPNNKLLIQLRSKDKSTNPNLLDISGAGHLSSGEGISDGIRELKEELGIEADFKKMTYLKYIKLASDNESKVIKPYHNREFAHTFFLEDDRPLNSYILQPEELDGIFEIDINQGKKLFLNYIEEVEIQGFIRNDDNILIERKRKVKIEDFAKHDFLWLKIFNLIEDYNLGRKNLII